MGFTQQKGSEAEDRACRHLQAQGLTLVQRNYRVARGPFRRGGEIDLIMRAPDGTLVFVEVRARAQARQGGAGASVTWVKQRRLALAAQHFLLRWPSPPPCRFDVVAVEGQALQLGGSAEGRSGRRVRQVWIDLGTMMEARLRSTTLDQLVAREAAEMYYI